MAREILRDGVQIKQNDDAEMDAEFERHSVNIDEILARTQRSFGSRTRRRIYEAPEFVKRLNPFEEVTAGETVTFECQWRALPRASIKWYKDDEEITEDPRYRYETDDIQNGTMRLILNKVKRSDEGTYKCKAENQEGVASTTGYLSVSGGAQDDEKTLAAKQKEQQQNRRLPADHAASSAPHLRTIIEQQSVEEREAECLRNQPPSPIQEFIDKIQSGRARGVTWPLMSADYQNGLNPKDDDQSSGSDTSVNSQEYDDVTFSVDVNEVVFTDAIPSRELDLLAGHVTDRPNGAPPVARQKAELAPPAGGRRKQEADVAGRRPVVGENPPCSIIENLLKILDSQWIYFVPLVSVTSFGASATQIGPLFLILPLMIISFVIFHLLFTSEDT